MKVIPQIMIDNLLQSKNVAIFTHTSADGDAIGSSSALFFALTQLGKNVDLYADELYKDSYAIMPTINLYKDSLDKKVAYDLLVAVDCPDAKRLGAFENFFVSHPNTLMIDHHRGNTHFGKINYVNFEKGANCENILKVIKKLNVNIDEKIASPLFMGFITDTGCFKYQNVSSATLKDAAFLIEHGARDKEIKLNFFQSRSLLQVELIKTLYENLIIIEGGEIAYSFLPHDLLTKLKANKEHIAGYPALVSEINNVNIALFFSEFETNKIDVSIRSFKPFSSERIAKIFNGGGHNDAAGCKYKGTMLQAIDDVVSAAQKEIEIARKQIACN